MPGRTPAHWRRVALIVARMTGKRVGLDTSTRIAADADFSPDQEFSAFFRGDDGAGAALPDVSWRWPHATADRTSLGRAGRGSLIWLVPAEK